jgi:hypothetical protein
MTVKTPCNRRNCNSPGQISKEASWAPRLTEFTPVQLRELKDLDEFLGHPAVLTV